MSYRFEIFDNSQMMGQATVGSMVVWDNETFNKEDYRLYNLNEKDEYGQMREMLTRRALKFEENPPPDMWVIDGGKALVDLAKNILQSVGVYIDVIGIAKEKIDAKAYRAKGAAKDIIYTTQGEILKLETSDKRLQFFQRLRDEAHRTAINFHKKQKRAEDKKISLLEIKGIGKAKIQKLLKYFGTFENIKDAPVNELKEVLNEKDAIILATYFQSKES
jgi:excinuclease ABC subunit C